MRRPCRWLLCVFGIVCGLAGCRLGEYEARIDEQQKRVAILDEENRLLSADAIEPPKIETKDAAKKEYWPFDVFFRVPRGVSTQPTMPGYTFNGQDPPLFRYAGAKDNVFLAAGLVPDEKKAEKGKTEKDKPRPQEWPIDTFRSHVRGALMDFYRKEYKGNPEFPLFERTRFQKIVKQPIPDRAFAGPTIEYEAIAFKDDKQGLLFQVYFHHWENRQIGVIVQTPSAAQNDATVTASVDWSLRTLDIGPAAAAKRSILSNRRNFRL